MKKTWTILAMAGLLAVSTACAKQEGSASNTEGSSGTAVNTAVKATDTYPNAQLLADDNWVQDHLKDPKVVIIDARSKGYEQGHIPGAVAVNTAQVKDSKNNTIVDKDKFTALIQNAGVNKDSTVVVYDEGNALSATRIFYSLEYYGLKDHVKVLNGGFAAWTAASKEVSADKPAPAKGNFTAVPNDKLVTTKDQIKKLDVKECVLVDARSAKEYSGEDLRGNKKGGHIEGAVNEEWSDAIDTNTADGVPKFKSYADLKAAFEKIGVVKDKTVIPYCQTNVRGAHVYFTLRLLGYSDIRPYEGSWAEWGNSDDTKVVQ